MESNVPVIYSSNQEQDSTSARKQYPCGFYFDPRDEDLIVHYLKKKADNQPIDDVCIFDVDIYKFNPWELIEMYPTLARDGERYFYTSTERKYLNGTRPNRAAGDGYWKATVASQRIYYNNNINDCVGFKKTLVFFQGKAGKGKEQKKKTNWIMHEYTLNRPPRPPANDNMRLDDCVLCRIHHRRSGPNQPPNLQQPSNQLMIQNGTDQDFDPNFDGMYDDLWPPSNQPQPLMIDDVGIILEPLMIDDGVYV